MFHKPGKYLILVHTKVSTYEPAQKNIWIEKRCNQPKPPRAVETHIVTAVYFLVVIYMYSDMNELL